MSFRAMRIGKHTSTATVVENHPLSSVPSICGPCNDFTMLFAASTRL